MNCGQQQLLVTHLCVARYIFRNSRRPSLHVLILTYVFVYVTVVGGSLWLVYNRERAFAITRLLAYIFPPTWNNDSKIKSVSCAAANCENFPLITWHGLEIVGPSSQSAWTQPWFSAICCYSTKSTEGMGEESFFSNVFLLKFLIQHRAGSPCSQLGSRDKTVTWDSRDTYLTYRVIHFSLSESCSPSEQDMWFDKSVLLWSLFLALLM